MESNGVWEESFTFQKSQADEQGAVRITTLCSLLQEIANNHADFRKLGYADMQEKGLFWALSRLRIKVDRYPAWKEKIALRTWVSEMEPFSHRHFTFHEPSGAIIASAYTIWVPVNVETRKPARLKTTGIPLMNILSPSGAPEKLLPSSDAKPALTHVVVSDDLDLAGHTNNVKYVEWIMAHYDAETQKSPRALVVNYLGETLLRDEVMISFQPDADYFAYRLQIAGSGKEVCLARVYL